MISALDCANWLIEQASDDINGGEYLTQLKVQKLLYFAQGISLYLYNKPLFEDKIYHEKYGPVVRSVIKYLKPFGNLSIETLYKRKDLIKFNNNKEALNTLSLAYENFGIFSASKLVELTHNDSCWKNHNDGEEITQEEIKRTFKKIFQIVSFTIQKSIITQIVPLIFHSTLLI